MEVNPISHRLLTAVLQQTDDSSKQFITYVAHAPTEADNDQAGDFYCTLEIEIARLKSKYPAASLIGLIDANA